jgi:hypothetical protein
MGREAPAGEGAPDRPNPRSTHCRLPVPRSLHPQPRRNITPVRFWSLLPSPFAFARKLKGRFGAKPGPRNRPGRRSSAARRPQAGRVPQPNHRRLLLPEDAGFLEWDSDHDLLVPLQLSEPATKTQRFFEIPAHLGRRGEFQLWLCRQGGLEKLSVGPRPHESVPAP